LLLPFGVTAVDLAAAQLVAIRRGAVIDAVLATIAVPGVFPPRELGGRTLIDGGILDPVPVRLARQLAPGLPVVAVSLSPPLEAWETPEAPRLLNSMPFLATYLGRLRIARALNVFLQSIDISGASLSALRLELDQPEVILRPAVPAIGLLDTVDVEEVARLGEAAVTENLDELNRAVGWRAWAGRQVRKPPQPELIEVSTPVEAEGAAAWQPKRAAAPVAEARVDAA
jgi:NTE family protein